jgi:predicted nucleic acid-binding Zn ribbon protein
MDRTREISAKVERPEAVLAWLTRSWPTIAGKTLAAHTRPVRCQDGYLEVVADGRGWCKQLEGMKHEFCARVNQVRGGNLVRDIKFIAAKPGPKSVPSKLDIEHTPFVRKRKG